MFLFPLGPPVKVCTTPLWGPEVRVHCWPDPLWKLSEDFSRTTCWTLDHRMLGGQVAGVTPLARLGNLPRPPTCCYLTRCFFIFTVPNQFGNPVSGQEPTFLGTSTHHWWQTNIQSGQNLTQWNTVLWLTIYRPFCLFVYVSAVGIISPVELAREVSHVRIRVRHG